MSKRVFFKIAKWFAGIILGLVLLITGGLYFFKDDIIGFVMDELNQHLKAKVSVSKVDLTFWSTFPHLSVDFNHVFIQDSYENSTPKDTLLYSDRIRLKFNPFDVWKEDYTVKKIDVAPGTLQLKVNKEGLVNYDIFKPSEDSTAQSKFEFKLKEVDVESLRFGYLNASVNQYYKATINELNLQGDFSEKQFVLEAISDLHVNEAKSGHVNLISDKPAKFDLKISVNRETDVFELKDANLSVSNLPFLVSGRVTKDSLDFHFSGKDLTLVEVANNFSMSEFDKVRELNGSGQVHFQLDIDGARSNTDPVAVECTFGVKNGQLIEPSKNQRINRLFVDGKYSNRGGAQKEFLSLKNIGFQTSSGSFSGNLLVTQFNAPTIAGDASGNINLAVIQALFPVKEIQTIKGVLGVDTDFIIQAVPQPNETFLYDIHKIEGDADIKNVALQLVDDKRLFHGLNGNISLRNENGQIRNFSAHVGKSDFLIQGEFTNIINYIKKNQSIVARVDVVSNHISVEDLGSSSKNEPLTEQKSFVFPETIEANVDLKIQNLSYEGHSFNAINGVLAVKDRMLQFPSLRFSNANADVTGVLSIEERAPELFYVNTQLGSNNIELKKVFREWNNFSQKVIQEENIYGNAQIGMSLEAPFDLRTGVIFKAIKSEINLKVMNGRLKNVDALTSIVKSLKTPAAKLAIGSENINMLETKLKDLTFETLENKLLIRNGKIEIPQMLIRSSALNMAVSGTHTFENQIDYRFAFRFRDLKAPKDSEFGNIMDDGTGINVYMRMYGHLDNPKIEWDKAARKEDRKEYNEKEKENLKSMLKSEFGLFQNDTAVKTFQKVNQPKETIEIDFGEEPTKEEIEKLKKEGKFAKWKKKMEEENKNKTEFEFE